MRQRGRDCRQRRAEPGARRGDRVPRAGARHVARGDRQRRAARWCCCAAARRHRRRAGWRRRSSRSSIASAVMAVAVVDRCRSAVRRSRLDGGQPAQAARLVARDRRQAWSRWRLPAKLLRIDEFDEAIADGRAARVQKVARRASDTESCRDTIRCRCDAPLLPRATPRRSPSDPGRSRRR